MLTPVRGPVSRGTKAPGSVSDTPSSISLVAWGPHGTSGSVTQPQSLRPTHDPSTAPPPTVAVTPGEVTHTKCTRHARQG